MSQVRFLAALAVGALIIGLFGWDRVFTGIIVAALVGVIAAAVLFLRDRIEVGPNGLTVRTPLHQRHIGWNQVIGCRFGIVTEEREVWVLALRVPESVDLHGTLLLLRIPPVCGPPAGAYDIDKREQLMRLLQVLEQQDVMISVHPEIAGALREHWSIGS